MRREVYALLRSWGINYFKANKICDMIFGKEIRL